MKGYCNPYDGDFAVCHVSKFLNSKNIRKIVISVSVIQLSISCPQNADIVTTFVKSAIPYKSLVMR